MLHELKTFRRISETSCQSDAPEMDLALTPATFDMTNADKRPADWSILHDRRVYAQEQALLGDHGITEAVLSNQRTQRKFEVAPPSI